MNRILLQPSGGPEALLHFGDTIEKLVPIEVMLGHLSNSDLAARIKEHFPNGSAAAWGLTPTMGQKIWPDLEQGDVVLFSGDNRVFASATLVEKIHSPTLARQLWGQDDNGHTWEFMYLLDDVLKQDIQVPAVASVLDYSPNWVVRRAQLLTVDQSRAMDSRFGLFGNAVPPSVTKEEYERAIGQLDPNAPLDRSGYSNSRVEQGYLRKTLFGRNTHGQCAICGEKFPIALLVAAHIKKRALCSDHEKRDAKNIVAAMCAMGCDALFERGIVSAKRGKVVAGKGAEYVSAVSFHIGKVVGRELTGYSAAQEKYFEAHRSYHSIV